jgi:hypothetical protein
MPVTQHSGKAVAYVRISSEEQLRKSVANIATQTKSANVLVGRPLTVEIIKKGRPVERQSVLLEVSQRK